VNGGRVHIVGVGPGDPELLTLKALRVIKEADVVIYTGSLISEELKEIFKEKTALDSSKMTLEEIVKEIEVEAKKGRKVVRVHDGDPSIYGALTEEVRELNLRGIEVEVVPGVSSFLAAASSLKVELTCPGGPQSVIITRYPYRTSEGKGMLVDGNSSVVVFLSVHLIDKVKEEMLKAFSPETPCAVVYHASRPDEITLRGRVGDIDQIVRSHRISSTAIIIVSQCLGPVNSRSHLYSPEFTHSYRRGTK